MIEKKDSRYILEEVYGIDFELLDEMDDKEFKIIHFLEGRLIALKKAKGWMECYLDSNENGNYNQMFLEIQKLDKEYDKTKEQYTELLRQYNRHCYKWMSLDDLMEKRKRIRLY